MKKSKEVLAQELTTPVEKVAITTLFEELSSWKQGESLSENLADSLNYLISTDTKQAALKKAVLITIRSMNIKSLSDTQAPESLDLADEEAYNKRQQESTQRRKAHLDFINTFFHYNPTNPNDISLDNLIALIRGEGVDMDTETAEKTLPLDLQKKNQCIDNISVLNRDQKAKAKGVLKKLTEEGRLGFKSSYKGMKNVNYFTDSTGKTYHRKVVTDFPQIPDYTVEQTYNHIATKDIKRMELYGKALMDKNNKYVPDLKNNIDKLKSSEMREYFTDLFSQTEMNISSVAKEQSLYDAMAGELGDEFNKQQRKILADIFLEQEGGRWLDDVDSSDGVRRFVYSNAVRVLRPPPRRRQSLRFCPRRLVSYGFPTPARRAEYSRYDCKADRQ